MSANPLFEVGEMVINILHPDRGADEVVLREHISEGEIVKCARHGGPLEIRRAVGGWYYKTTNGDLFTHQSQLRKYHPPDELTNFCDMMQSLESKQGEMA